MPAMKRHYKSRQHPLTLWQSVIATSEQAKRVAGGDNSHSIEQAREAALIFAPSGSALEKTEESMSVHLRDLSHIFPCQ